MAILPIFNRGGSMGRISNSVEAKVKLPALSKAFISTRYLPGRRGKEVGRVSLWFRVP